MQENTESEKPEDSEIPENQEEVPDEKTTSESTGSPETNPHFEEHEGEVLPPEKKKGSGCGFFIFIFLLLTGGSGYLYYTHQIPPQIREWVEPLIKPLEQQLAKVAPGLAPRSSEKRVSQVEEKNIASTIHKEIPVVEEKSAIATNPQASNEEHMSGSQTESVPEVTETDSDYPANISGNSTFVEQETLMEEPVEEVQVKETIVDSAPVVIAPLQPAPYVEKPRQNFSEEPAQPKKEERNQAVQAYLDFFEETLVKIGELIKTGFAKGKDFLMKYLS